jgi:hypothetical protein
MICFIMQKTLDKFVLELGRSGLLGNRLYSLRRFLIPSVTTQKVGNTSRWRRLMHFSQGSLSAIVEYVCTVNFKTSAKRKDSA